MYFKLTRGLELDSKPGIRRYYLLLKHKEESGISQNYNKN